MKRFLTYFVLLCSLFLGACQAEPTTTITVPPCEWGFTETMYEEIPIVSLTAPKSVIVGSAVNFVDACKPADDYEIFFHSSTIKSHQIVFSFDAIYPLEDIVLTGYIGADAATIGVVSIDLSLNGLTYDRFATSFDLTDGSGVVTMENASAKYVRLTFPAILGITYGLQDIRFHLGDGFIVREATEWTDALLRYQGWTGADGIFSFNLNGDDSIGAVDPETAFVFSDTFVGTVNTTTLRRSNTVMINNSIGYYDGNTSIFDGFTFAYGHKGITPASAFLPDAYVGYRPANLLDSDGLSSYLDPAGRLGNLANGVMWRTEKSDENFVTVDFGDVHPLGQMTIWNYNETPAYGVDEVTILFSDNAEDWTTGPTVHVPQASGNFAEPASLTVNLTGFSSRYVTLDIGSSRDDTMVGLGKLLFQNAAGDPLFGIMMASGYDETVAGNETTSRLWLQDGVVLDHNLYLFPLLVKDDPGAFKVTRVGMIKVPITDGTIDFADALYLPTPLQSRAADGGMIYYGAGVMAEPDPFGYIYVYGYKDYHGRHLVVARVYGVNIENFNAWTYFDGSGWSADINDSAPLLEGVSPELSVAKIDTGLLAGKYMLVAMESTTSGKVSYSVGETPWGPFSSFHLLYQATEPATLNNTFTYNAKMHVHLSQPGSYLISYNVNSSDMSAFSDARIYHPRFILVTEVKRP